MSFINRSTFHGSRSSILSYRNQSFMNTYNRMKKGAKVSNSLFNNTMNDTFSTIKRCIAEKENLSVKRQDTSYSRLSKYKSNDDVFEKALKRLNNNSNFGINASKLSAKNSTLDLASDKYFNIKTKSGKTVTLACDNGTVYMPGDVDNLSNSDIREVEDIGHLLTYLNHDSTGVLAFKSFSESSIKDMLASVGIKPGFFEIKSSGESNKFLMLDNGSIYSEHQVEAERSFYNETDLIKNAGFTKDAVCIIDGKEYKIDENGHFNIPKGVRCVAENMIIKK